MEKLINFANGNNEDDMNYPIGIQTFNDIRNADFAYVDKTAHVYRLASQGALANGMTKEQCYERLRLEYDGYHFSAGGTSVYNPFSLLNVLSFGVFRMENQGNLTL